MSAASSPSRRPWTTTHCPAIRGARPQPAHRRLGADGCCAPARWHPLHPWSRSPIVQRRGTARYANRGSSPRTSPSRISWRAWKRSTASSRVPGYPGRLAEQMWESFIYRDELSSGVLDFDGLTVDPSRIAVPVQLVGSHRDALCTWKAARHGIELHRLTAGRVHHRRIQPPRSARRPRRRCTHLADDRLPLPARGQRLVTRPPRTSERCTVRLYDE